MARQELPAAAVKKVCSCGSDSDRDGTPHSPGCPKYVDRSATWAVIEALRRRYSQVDGEWVFFREVWRIDAFAIRCWDSGIGHRRIAFEVKTSRSDFLAEMRKPSKRREALAISHQFFFVVPKGLVRPDEIPPECGLMVVDGDQRVRIVKHAPVRAPRALVLREAIYLMRVPMFRDGLLEMRRKLTHLERTHDWQHETRQEDRDRMLRMEDRLVAYAKHLVVVGSTWRGRWQPGLWMKVQEDVEVYVEDVRASGRYLTVRRLDTGEVDSFVLRSRLLSDFVPLDMPLVVV